MVRRLSCYAVVILRQHCRYSASCDEVAHAVHPRPPQGRPTVATIHNLLQDLVTLTDGVLAQRFHLLGEGVPAARLPLCRDAGVENDWAGSVIFGTVQHPLPSFLAQTNTIAFPVPLQVGQGTHPPPGVPSRGEAGWYTRPQSQRQHSRSTYAGAPITPLSRRPSWGCRCAQQARQIRRNASGIETSTRPGASMPPAGVVSARQTRTLDWFRPRWLLSSVVLPRGVGAPPGPFSSALIYRINHDLSTFYTRIYWSFLYTSVTR